MKIKLGALENTIMSLQAVKAKKLPVRVQYAIAVNIKKLAEKQIEYIQQRTETLEKNCIKDNEGMPVIKKEDIKNEEGEVVDTQEEYTYNGNDKEKTLKELTELANIEEDIELHMLPLEDLERCDSNEYDTLTGSDMQALLLMIKD